MSATTISTQQELLEDATKLASGLQQAVTYASELEGELKAANAQLATKDAEIERLKKARTTTTEPVVLQKVAAFDDDTLDQTLNMLCKHELLAESDREKMATTLRAGGPEAALRLVQQVAAITTPLPAPSGGRGIEKAAGAQTPTKRPHEYGDAKTWLVP